MAKILEVQRFDDEAWRKPPYPGKFRHIGYVYRIFSSDTKAQEWYAARFPHMRPIRDGCSDWDPDTHDRYVIRTHHGGEDLSLERRPPAKVEKVGGRVISVTSCVPRDMEE